MVNQKEQSEPNQQEKQSLEQKARDGTITDQERTRLSELQREKQYKSGD